MDTNKILDLLAYQGIVNTFLRLKGEKPCATRREDTLCLGGYMSNTPKESVAEGIIEERRAKARAEALDKRIAPL